MIISLQQLQQQVQDKEHRINTHLAQKSELDILAVTNESTSLRDDLEQEKQIRLKKEEYAVLHKAIRLFQSREQSRQDIQALVTELNKIEGEKLNVLQSIEDKKKQFSLFFHAANELHNACGVISTEAPNISTDVDMTSVSSLAAATTSSA
jgi:uncharacterized membrane protein YhiD involved in acid resistance